MHLIMGPEMEGTGQWSTPPPSQDLLNKFLPIISDYLK